MPAPPRFPDDNVCLQRVLQSPSTRQKGGIQGEVYDERNSIQAVNN